MPDENASPAVPDLGAIDLSALTHPADMASGDPSRIHHIRAEVEETARKAIEKCALGEIVYWEVMFQFDPASSQVVGILWMGLPTGIPQSFAAGCPVMTNPFIMVDQTFMDDAVAQGVEQLKLARSAMLAEEMPKN